MAKQEKRMPNKQGFPISNVLLHDTETDGFIASVL